MKTGRCALCGRDSQEIKFHHLIPKSLHNNKWFRKRYTKKFMSRGEYLCKNDCHAEIHRFIPEKEMGKEYNTINLLLTHSKVAKFVEWVKKR